MEKRFTYRVPFFDNRDNFINFVYCDMLKGIDPYNAGICHIGDIELCTGLKDKNGKLIYEGDIVKIPTQCNKELHGSYSLQEIVWRNGNWILSYISSEKGSKLPRGWTAGFLHNYWSDEFEKEFIFTNADIFCTYNELEVIGNIYENKDLLKEKDNGRK